MSETRFPLVSVVMPVYNGERFLGEAIDSILGQSFTDFEFVIVDDGSEDGSAAICQAYARQDGRIRVLQHERNMGAAHSRNTGIAAASGQYIAGMDCDDVSLPERLQRQVDYLNENPAIGAVGVGAQVVNEDLSVRYAYRLPECHALILLSMLFGETAIVRASIMARREFVLASSGYDSQFRASDEDYEFFLRLVWQAGIRYASLTRILYLYRYHGDSGTVRGNSWNPAGKAHARRDALERLWGEAPEETLDMLQKLRPGYKLGWRARRRARRDLQRLIEAIVAHGWVEAREKPLLAAEIRQRLEWTTPRLWQMFLHWLRHHFGARAQT